MIGGNGDSIFKRLMIAAERPDIAEDERFADNSGRVKYEEEIDDALSCWCKKQISTKVLETLDLHDVPSGPIYNAEDMIHDPHFIERGLFESVKVKNKLLKIPSMVPKLSKTPGSTLWAGPEIGSFNKEIELNNISKHSINNNSTRYEYRR